MSRISNLVVLSELQIFVCDQLEYLKRHREQFVSDQLEYLKRHREQFFQKTKPPTPEKPFPSDRVLPGDLISLCHVHKIHRCCLQENIAAFEGLLDGMQTIVHSQVCPAISFQYSGLDIYIALYMILLYSIYSTMGCPQTGHPVMRSVTLSMLPHTIQDVAPPT